MSLILNGTTGLSGVDGSSSTPALQGNDSNTGVSFGTDTVTINTGGVARVTTDASGNVGVGTTSVISPLTVQSSSPFGFGLDLINNASNLSRLRFCQTGTTSSWSSIQADGRSTGFLGFFTNDTERARIDSLGNLLVGTTSPINASYRMSVVGAFGIYIQGTTATYNPLAFLNSAGALGGYVQVTGTTTSYVTSSDYRLKENVVPMTGALAKVAALKPVTYTWKADGSAGQGFIAHELQAVVPDCVTGEKDAVDAEGNPQYQGVDTSFLVATLVAAIQELKAEVDALKGATP